MDVASSNLVVRSQDTVTATVLRNRRLHGGLAERRGSGLQSRIHGFESRTHLGENHGFRIISGWTWAIGAAVARFPDTEEVTGSIPVSPTCSSSPRSCFFYLPGHPSPTRHHRSFPHRGNHSRQSEPVGGTASAAGERPEPPISWAGLPGGARIECGGATWLRD